VLTLIHAPNKAVARALDARVYPLRRRSGVRAPEPAGLLDTPAGDGSLRFVGIGADWHRRPRTSSPKRGLFRAKLPARCMNGDYPPEFRRRVGFQMMSGHSQGWPGAEWQL
jgi:hypothetical protein